jgi:putative ABC transport system permease protein
VAIGGNRKPPLPIEIIGVVANAKYKGVRDQVEPQLFLSLFEHPGPDTATVYIRTTHSPESMFGAFRRTVQEIDPELPLFRMRTMEEHVERSLANERLMAGLSTTFGVFATLLAVVGLINDN